MLRKLAAEFIGTAGLVAAVVGSGIMAERLAGGNMALALLANTAATGAALFVLILSLAQVSGAHLNPAVTLAALVDRKMSARLAAGYAVVQTMGGIGGAVLANVMFELPPILVSQKVRSGAGQWISEVVAAFGLVFVIAAVGRMHSPFATAAAVAAFISSAYWFTASTSFANPAVTIGRAFSDSFAGIGPASVPMFVVCQFSGAMIAVFTARWLFSARQEYE